MALSRTDATRRQLRPVRTEQEVAADVLMRLFDQDLLRTTAQVMANVAAATGVPVPALREAKHRADQRGYLAPASTCAITAVPDKPPTGEAFKTDEAARAHAEGVARGQLAGGAARSKQPPPGADTVRCSRCCKYKPLDDFAYRSDRPHLRWTVCDPCRAAAQKSRYLSVQKRQALNAARLTFTIVEGDERADLRCMDCGSPFRPGDHVYGDAALHHVDCGGGA